MSLVVVGKQGWMVDELAAALRVHPEQGKRLLWLEDASDEFLERVYAHARVLLAPSLAEGFGLPLIEAARHGLPILARDLPVFREVAGEHAFYFSGEAAADLAKALTDWLALDREARVPDSRGIRWKAWHESVDELLGVVLHDRWDRSWSARAAHQDVGNAAIPRDIDFSRHTLPRAVYGIAGLSGREDWGRWSDADVSPSVEIRFRSPLPSSGLLTVTARAFGPNAGKPVLVRIGSYESEMRFETHDTTVSVPYILGFEPNTLEIVPPNPVAPRELGWSDDPRRLGVGLVRLTVT